MAGHIYGILGLDIRYIKACILTFRSSSFECSLAIRICERETFFLLLKEASKLLLRRKEVPTHFYEERKTLQKDSRLTGRIFHPLLP